MELHKKLPLFLVTGASGVGKSSLCQQLLNRETEYIVMESDILWHDRFNTPEDGYRAYRETWLTLCAHISQIGKPVVLCGCVTPEQLETLKSRSFFTELFYLAVVCEDSALEHRMRDGRGITDENWIQSSLSFNRWLREHRNLPAETFFALDTTRLTPQEAAPLADMWILSKIKAEKPL